MGFLRVITYSPPEQPTPSTLLCAPLQSGKDVLNSLYYEFVQMGVPAYLAYFVADIYGMLVAAGCFIGGWAVALLVMMGETLAQVAFVVLAKLRQGVDVAAAQFAADLLNELFGTTVGPENIPYAQGGQGHLARAQVIGAAVHDALASEFSPPAGADVASTDQPARVFTGFVANFSVATGLIGLLGEIESLGFIDAFREIPEQMARNLGLGRLSRQALKPLVKTLVELPYTWWLNQRYHPKIPTIQEVVNPFAQAVFQPDAIAAIGDLNGYAPGYISEFIRIHQKKLNVTDVDTLVRWGLWTEDAGLQYITDLGYNDQDAQTALHLEELRRADNYVRKFVDLLLTDVRDGHIQPADLESQITSLPLAERERAMILILSGVGAKTPHKSLSLAELQQALVDGVVTLDEVDAHLTAAGYVGDDQNTLLALTLLKVARVAEAVKVTQYKYDLALAAAKKKGEPPPPLPPLLVVQAGGSAGG